MSSFSVPLHRQAGSRLQTFGFVGDRLAGCNKGAGRGCPSLSIRAAAQRHSEEDWQRELSAGSTRSRAAQLNYARVQVPTAGPSQGSSMLKGLEEAAPAAVQDAAAAAPRAPAWLSRWLEKWETLPARYRFVVATSLAFVVCNMDKVNMSVAIIPMAHEFGWSPTTSGLIQSSFFWGYMLTQIPGGYITSLFGGRRVLPAGVGLWSAATAVVPFAAGTIPGLLVSRAFVGLGEGIAPSAATDMVARIGNENERSRSISFIYSGLHVGSLLGLLVAPQLIDHFGWQTVFYLFGGVGLAWTWWWERLMGDIAMKEPEAARRLVEGSSSDEAGTAETPQHPSSVPWRAFLRNRPVQALAFTHFTNNWMHYTMLAWLPTFFSETLSMDISHAAQLSLLPPLAALAASSIAGPAADALIDSGWEVARVRKAAQLVAFLGPASCLLAAMAVDDAYVTVGLITASLGLASFSLAGLYCNHADLSPRHAPVLLGLTNTIGAVPGVVGVAVTGALLDATGSWPVALFAPSIALFLVGSAVFTVYGRAERQDFTNNSPFGVERHLQPIVERLPNKTPSGLLKVQHAAFGFAERLSSAMQGKKS